MNVRVFAAILAAVPLLAAAPRLPAPRPSPPAKSEPAMQMPGMTMRPGDMPSAANGAGSMSREGSGTSWVPGSTQMFGWMQTRGRDRTMEHGAAFPRYVSSGSARGDRRADAPNWLMIVGTHGLDTRSQLTYRAMVSADPLTENETGYPLLFQTGESAHGNALHDHQHPHDLFDELAVDFSARIGTHASAYVYAGYPGEPALGPPAYMHRRIAYDMADAPIGHHWMDATHIQFGVITAGFAASSRIKIEASTFTGREPNEIRTNFDRAHLDSSSARLSWNPGNNAAVQASFGFIKSPEARSPLADQHRLTASVLLNNALGAGRNWYNGFVFGQNIETGGVRTNAYLAESDYQRGRDALFARAEFGTRTARDLVLPVASGEPVYGVGAYALGAVHDLSRNLASVDLGLGAQLTLGSHSAALRTFYGASRPIGFQVFLRVRPPDMEPAMTGPAGMPMKMPN